MQDANERDTNEQDVKELILCWNFPIFAEIFIDVLTNFVTTSLPNDLEDCCARVPSFAGFWYETLFFIHHQKEKSKITIAYNNVNTTNSVMLHVHVDEVKRLDPLQDKLRPKVLYELRTNHPIVDAVGLLPDNNGTPWLVFIQVSLQRYEHHRSLCDLFHRPASSAHTQKNISVFTHYRRLFKIDFGYKNVVLLYISPKEKAISTPILTKLENEILKLKNYKLKQSLNWGVISESSSLFLHFINIHYFKYASNNHNINFIF